MTSRSAASAWADRSLDELLGGLGLGGRPEAPFPNDGWSGARLTSIDGPEGRVIVKRTSWSLDWIARSTRDHALREAVHAAGAIAWPAGLAPAHLGAAADGTAAAIVMPDLSGSLIPWDRGDGGGPTVGDETLDRVLEAMAAIHAMPWAELRPPAPNVGPGAPAAAWPWCPLRERLELLSRPSAERYRDGGLWVGERFLRGWDAFDRLAPPAAVDLVTGLGRDVTPLVTALTALPSTGIHGDLKLANVALLPDGRAACIDWQMTAWAPVAVELGWFVVANVAQLGASPDAVIERALDRLAAAAGPEALGARAAQRDLAILVGLVLRGWRKGLDADAGAGLPTGVSGSADLAWWSGEAVAAAQRRL